MSKPMVITENVFSVYRLRLWSKAVRKRDGHVCQICGSGYKPEAHHLYNKADHPELALVVSNGITLCGSGKKTGNDCHAMFHNAFMGGTAVLCTPEDLDTLIVIIRWVLSINFTKIKNMEATA